MRFRENNFDLIRLVAALQVLVIHTVEHLKIPVPNFLMNGLSLFPGVIIFFVTSGYLISASFLRNDELPSFARNRALRIYPGLWVCFLVSFTTILIVFQERPNLFQAIVWTFSQLTFFQFYNPEIFRGYGTGVPNGSLWTIAVELQFYLLVPFIILSINRIGLTLLGSVVLLTFLFFFNQFFVSQSEFGSTLWYKLAKVSIFPYLCFFFVGVLLQRNQNLVEVWLADNVIIWLILYLLVAFFLSKIGLQVGGNNINAISAIFLSAFTLSLAYSGTKYFSGILRGNDISYGVYIYHAVVINVFVELEYIGSYIQFASVIGCTLLLAVSSWVLIEKPALRMKIAPMRALEV